MVKFRLLIVGLVLITTSGCVIAPMRPARVVAVPGPVIVHPVPVRPVFVHPVPVHPFYR